MFTVSSIRSKLTVNEENHAQHAPPLSSNFSNLAFCVFRDHKGRGIYKRQDYLSLRDVFPIGRLVRSGGSARPMVIIIAVGAFIIRVPFHSEEQLVMGNVLQASVAYYRGLQNISESK